MSLGEIQNLREIWLPFFILLFAFQIEITLYNLSINKKGSLSSFLSIFRNPTKLCRMNCFCRTCVSASSAICTSIRIDLIDITFRNCTYRTFIDTSSASNTIFINYVSHDFSFFNIITNFDSANIISFFVHPK